MLESWIFYAIVSSVLVGIYGFMQKVEAEGSLNTNSFIFYAYSGCIIYPLLHICIFGGSLSFDMTVLPYALFCNIVYTIALRIRIHALQYLSSSAFFINYRIFSSTLLIILGQVLFQEYITFKEYLGIGSAPTKV